MVYTTHTTLLSRLSEGVDPNAWREFQNRYAELIRGFAFRYGLQPTDCDDVVQEVLLSLSKAMGGFTYDPSKGKFRSYLKTLSLRTIFKILRQKKDQRELERNSIKEKAAMNPHIEEMWEEEWRQYHIRQAMLCVEKEFSDKDRLAFSHYVVKGRSVAETAEMLSISHDQVYQAKSRILKRLGRIIARQIREEG